MDTVLRISVVTLIVMVVFAITAVVSGSVIALALSVIHFWLPGMCS